LCCFALLCVTGSPEAIVKDDSKTDKTQGFESNQDRSPMSLFMTAMAATSPGSWLPLAWGPSLGFVSEREEELEKLGEGRAFAVNLAEIPMLDVRTDFADGRNCPQHEETLLTSCPDFLACSGRFEGLAFCRNRQWDQDGIDRVVTQSTIYHLPQPIVEYKAHVFRGNGLYITPTGHIFDGQYRYFHGGMASSFTCKGPESYLLWLFMLNESRMLGK